MEGKRSAPAALAYARRLLEFAQDPLYVVDGHDVPDLENLVGVLEGLSAPSAGAGRDLSPWVALVRPWEGAAAVVVDGRVVYRCPDDDPAFPNTAQAMAGRLAGALGCAVEELDLAARDWGQVEAALAAQARARGGDGRGKRAGVAAGPPVQANTCIRYTYRDGANYKFPGAAVLAGRVTEEQVRPHLHEGTSFIPGDVGLPRLHPTHCTFAEGIDHPWHELDSVEPTEAEPTVDLTAGEFLRRLREAARAGWPGQHADFAWE